MSLARAARENIIAGNIVGLDALGKNPLGNGQSGLSLTDGAAANTIGGNAPGAGNVLSANVNGVNIAGSPTIGSLIAGNKIGTDASGTLGNAADGRPLGNTAYGLLLVNGTTANTIGGNVLSANGLGLTIIGPDTGRQTIQGNKIGTDISGTAALGNRLDGIFLVGSAANTIGGNVISANLGTGVRLLGIESTGNVVQGNLIGLDASGQADLGNASQGVQIEQAPGNLIGGLEPGDRNVLSGNGGSGLLILGRDARGNRVLGNFAGTDINGRVAIGNVRDGVTITDAPGNRIGDSDDPRGRNILSGNGLAGVQVSGSDALGNVIAGNFVGTDVSGTQPLGNANAGVLVAGAPQTHVGGPTATARNLISGNVLDGVAINGSAAAGTVVEGNVVGLDVSGRNTLPNGRHGVFLSAGASSILIGGEGPGMGNVLSGNAGAGLALDGRGTRGNVAIGNRIGTDLDGQAALGNAIGVSFASPGNTLGGASSGAGNLISGNGSIGVQIAGAEAIGNVVIGNRIGTDAKGTRGLGNGIGVFIDGAAGNRIGGDQPGEGNVVSGNGSVGIYLFDRNASRTTVQGNRVGTDPTGTRVVERPGGGVSQDVGILLNGAPTNLIGGDNPAAGNLVSGQSAGIVIAGFLANGNAVRGNTIGTNAAGNQPIANQTGIYLNGAPGNTIGGTTRAAGNLISGNVVAGLTIFGQLASGNVIQGNFLGTDRDGASALPNGNGVFIQDAPSNTIGGTATGAGNLISGNRTVGIYVFSPQAVHNIIQGNAIGPRAVGRRPIGNGEYGVLLYNAPNNVVTRNGPGRNRIVASGIGNFREFTGPAPRRSADGNAAPSRRHRARARIAARSPQPRIGTALKIGPGPHPTGPLGRHRHVRS